MAKRVASHGTCMFCRETFVKSGMARHLQACKARWEADAAAKGQRMTTLYHLVVEGADRPQYWLHLEAPANITLNALDDFLRDIWLECCGHLSAFTIGDVTYSSYPDPSFGDRSMKISLGRVFSPGMKIHYEYDFGTTTPLTLRVLSMREGPAPPRRDPIRLLARNDPPDIRCEICGKPATLVCSFCTYVDIHAFCEECQESHECGMEGMLPLVNSPRTGMCAYGAVW